MAGSFSITPEQVIDTQKGPRVIPKRFIVSMTCPVCSNRRSAVKPTSFEARQVWDYYHKHPECSSCNVERTQRAFINRVDSQIAVVKTEQDAVELVARIEKSIALLAKYGKAELALVLQGKLVKLLETLT